MTTVDHGGAPAQLRTLDDLALGLSPEIRKAVEGLLVAFRSGTTAQRAELLDGIRALSTPAVREPFNTVLQGEYSQLDVRAGIDGLYECRFTLKGGASNLDTALLELNDKLANTKNCPTNWKVHLSGDNELSSKYPGTNDIVVICTPVIQDTIFHSRIDQIGILVEKGLEMVNNDLLRLMVGAFRVYKGFPSDPDEIGKPSDTGDLLQGFDVRTAKERRAVDVYSHYQGVDGRCSDNGSRNIRIAMAGALPQKK